MSSDHILCADDVSAAVDDYPSTSSSFGGGTSKVKLLCSYGGKILPRPSDGLLRYAGGNTRIVTVRRDCSMTEILRKLAEAYGGPVVFRYQLPGEELDALISLSTAEDLANMMEEYDKLIAENPSAKLRVFLYSPSELAGLASEHEFQSSDQDLMSSRYIEAVNGVDNYLRRKDSITSFSTQNSDCTAVADLGMDNGSIEGKLPAIPSKGNNHNDQLTSNSSSQTVPNLANAASSGNLNEGLNAVHTESPHVVANAPHAYIETLHPQLMKPHPFVFVGLPTPLNMVPVQPTQYVPVTHVSPISQLSTAKPAQSRAETNAEESSNIVKNPKPLSDPKLLPLSQLPPLPSPHLLAPSWERNESRQAQPSARGQAIRFEDCNLCQKGLQHVHSETLIHEQTNGSSNVIPETKSALQSHHSEDISRMQLPKMIVTGAIAGNIIEPHIGNVLGSASTQTANMHGPTPVGTYGLADIVPQVPRDSERSITFVAENLDQAKILGQLTSVGLQEPSKSYGVITNPQKTIQDEVISEKPALPKVACSAADNHGPSNVLRQTAPLIPPNNPSGILIDSPQSHREGAFQEQLQFQQAKAAENIDHAKTSAFPNSVGSQVPSQSSLGTATNPDHMHKMPVPAQSLNPNGDYDNPVYSQPSAFVQTANPSIMLTGPPQYYQQFPQTKVPVKQEAVTKPLGADGIPIWNINVQAEGQMIHENKMGYLTSNSRPLEGIKEALHVNPPDASNFNDYSKPVSIPIKDSKTEIPSLVTENGHIVKVHNSSTAMPVDNLPSSSGVILDTKTGRTLDPILSAPQNFVYISNPQPAKAGLFTYVTGSDIPSMYYHEAGSAVMGITSSFYNSTVTGEPPGEWKHDMLNFQHNEVMNDTTGPASVNSNVNANSHAINMEQVQMTSDPFILNDDSENSLVSPILKPRSTTVASKESVAMKDMHSDIYPGNGKGSDLSMLSESVSWIPASSQSKNIHADITQPLTEEDEQAAQTTVEGKAAHLVNQSKSSVPDLISHESIDVNSCYADGSKENSIVMDDHKMETTKNKQSEKTNNSFPNADNVGHLQVIKNSDLEELRELGSGTFGTVYHGKWRGTDVAIKRLNDRVFNAKQSDQEKARADFWNEACKLASLHHPNVVAFYGIVLDGPGGSIATVTEFMVNGSLRTVMQKNDKTLDRRRRLLIAMDVAFGMEYLHSKNIIHFDLKSDNLLVNLRDPQRPICKVGDLGLSKLKYETLMSGGMRGTLPWMAPELLGGSTKHTEKVDVFSFGIVMWELLTSKEPYADLHYGVIIGGIINNKLRPEVPESCDPDWRLLMEDCWSNEPIERPNFTEIANRLRAMSTSPQKG